MKGQSYTSYIADQMTADEDACFRAALAAGYTINMAESCCAGQLNCEDCPWQPKKSAESL